MIRFSSAPTRQIGIDEGETDRRRPIDRLDLGKLPPRFVSCFFKQIMSRTAQSPASLEMYEKPRQK